MQFVKSESRIKPKKVELSGNMAFIRKNIICEKREVENNEKINVFTYEEAYCTKDDAINYLSEINEELEKENSNNNESILNLDFRVSELEG